MFILEFYQIMPIKERANKNRSRSAVKERLRAINCLRREGVTQQAETGVVNSYALRKTRRNRQAFP